MMKKTDQQVISLSGRLYHHILNQPVWLPHLKKHSRDCTTKLIDGFSQLSYMDRLQKLDLQQYWRERNDMIELYKHFNHKKI